MYDDALSRIAIRLDNPECLPRSFLQHAEHFRDLFKTYNYMDQVLQFQGFRYLLDEVDNYILGRRVYAYHCTKQLEEGFIKSRGLRPLRLKQHIDDFLNLIREEVSDDLYTKFGLGYEGWAKCDQIAYREGMIWFCMSRHLVCNEGTHRFFTYYGGEALYWPFTEGGSCLEYLATVGSPVVVEALLPAKDFTVFKEFGFARDILSHFGQRFNEDFFIDSLEANIRRDVTPDEIMAVYPLQQFLRERESEC